MTNTRSTSRPEFSGFDAYYESNILPEMQSIEAQRLDALGKVKKSSIVAGIAALAGLFIGLRIGHPIAIASLTALPIMGGAAAATHYTKGQKESRKAALVGGICTFLGWTYSVDLQYPPDVSPFLENGLLPSYDRGKYEDHMQGQLHGADFQFYEAHLEKEQKTDNGSNWVTRFRGLVFSVDFNKEFLGKTVVLRDKGIFNRKKRKDMKRVGLVDPVFEKIFEAYSTDQVESRYLLTPDFMQRLVDLENSVKGEKIRFGFLDGKLLIAVECKNQFEPGSLFSNASAQEHVERVSEEFSAVMHVIDAVMKPLDNPYRA